MPRTNPERDREICQLYLADMPVARIAVRFEVQPTAIFRALRRGAVLPPYKTRRTSIARKVYSITPAPIRPRDPCPRCATRADIGCRHSAMVEA